MCLCRQRKVRSQIPRGIFTILFELVVEILRKYQSLSGRDYVRRFETFELITWPISDLHRDGYHPVDWASWQPCRYRANSEMTFANGSSDCPLEASVGL